MLYKIFNCRRGLIIGWLYSQAFTSHGLAQYYRQLQRFPRGPGYRRIQSPHHILSYSLREHGQWLVTMVPLCRVWLRDIHLKGEFRTCLRQALHQEIANGFVRPDSSATGMLIILLKNIAHSNAVLTTGKLSTQDRSRFWPIVSSGRVSFQRLCEAAVLATSMPKRGRQRGQPQVPVQASSRATSVDTDVVETSSLQPATEDAALVASKKKKQYLQYKALPNVHVGHHYVDVLDRYGLVSLLTVFAGEQKHKLVLGPTPPASDDKHIKTSSLKYR